MAIRNGLDHAHRISGWLAPAPWYVVSAAMLWNGVDAVMPRNATDADTEWVLERCSRATDPEHDRRWVCVFAALQCAIASVHAFGHWAPVPGTDGWVARCDDTIRYAMAQAAGMAFQFLGLGMFTRRRSCRCDAHRCDVPWAWTGFALGRSLAWFASAVFWLQALVCCLRVLCFLWGLVERCARDRPWDPKPNDAGKAD